MCDCVIERGFNGWRNYETWATALWAGEFSDGLSTDTIAYLQEYLEELLEQLGPSLAGDLLGACIREIDWRELEVATID